MSPLVIVLLSALVLVNAVEVPDSRESAREEKLRSALIDAFQSIKKGSAKGGVDEDLASDLIGSLAKPAPPNSSRNDKATTEDAFDVFSDDDGLSFADFSEIKTEAKQSTTEKSHNVQHIVKTTKPAEKTTSKPNRDVLSKLSDSILNTVNESRMALRRDSVNMTELMGIENMLRLFDADILVQQWPELQNIVSGECRQDMQDYVDGLMERQLWALKSEYFSVPINIKMSKTIKSPRTG